MLASYQKNPFSAINNHKFQQFQSKKIPPSNFVAMSFCICVTISKIH